MIDPVLVIHGVANRDRDDFTGTVERLGQAIGKQWNLIPVYWGDIGAEVIGIDDTIPQMQSSIVRGTEAYPDEGHIEELVRTFLPLRHDPTPKAIVLEAIHDGFKGSNELVRGSGGAEEILREAVEEQWPFTRWVKSVQSPAVLKSVGRSISISAQRYLSQGSNEFVTRGYFNDLKEFCKSLLNELDTCVGAALEESVGRFNQELRTSYAPGFVRFLGDVFVYQRRRDDIQKRLWDAIAQHAPGHGTSEKPIHVIAHSLGGVISFDAAISGQPRLWMKSFITFGSQPAFFHVLDPRGEDLPKYSPGHPVMLPPTIKKWINLWEPMDPLAFIAGKVFSLESGQIPEDIRVPHMVSSGLWTHSAYWEQPSLAAAIREAFA